MVNAIRLLAGILRARFGVEVAIQPSDSNPDLTTVSITMNQSQAATLASLIMIKMHDRYDTTHHRDFS